MAKSGTPDTKITNRLYEKSIPLGPTDPPVYLFHCSRSGPAHGWRRHEAIVADLTILRKAEQLWMGRVEAGGC
jgi:hypothetical protein